VPRSAAHRPRATEGGTRLEGADRPPSSAGGLAGGDPEPVAGAAGQAPSGPEAGLGEFEREAKPLPECAARSGGVASFIWS
jgi:hypothetical protein